MHVGEQFPQSIELMSHQRTLQKDNWYAIPLSSLLIKALETKELWPEGVLTAVHNSGQDTASVSDPTKTSKQIPKLPDWKIQENLGVDDTGLLLLTVTSHPTIS